MGLLDKVYGGAKSIMLNQFRKSIPKGLESGKIIWKDDLNIMAEDILDRTGKRSDFESLGITHNDIKTILIELKGKREISAS